MKNVESQAVEVAIGPLVCQPSDNPYNIKKHLEKLEITTNQQDYQIYNLNRKVNKISCPENKPGFAMVENNCYFFEKVGRTYEDAKGACRNVFGSGTEGRIFEPRSININNAVLTKSRYYLLGPSM